MELSVERMFQAEKQLQRLYDRSAYRVSEEQLGGCLGGRKVFRERIVKVEVRSDFQIMQGHTDCRKNVDLHSVKTECHWLDVRVGWGFIQRTDMI